MTLRLLRHRSTSLSVLAVVLSILAIWSASNAIGRAIVDSRDLFAIWNEAKTFWARQDPYALYLNFRLHAGSDPGYAPNYIPSFFVVMAPFFVLGWPIFKALFMTLSLGMCAGSVALLRRLFVPGLSPIYAYLLFCLVVASSPFREMLANGQLTSFAIFSFLCAWYFRRMGNDFLAVFLLFLALLKFTLTLPLALIFLRGRALWIAIVSVVAQIAILIMAAFWLGESPQHLFGETVRTDMALLTEGHINYSNIFRTFGPSGAYFGIVLSECISLMAFVVMALRRTSDELLSLTFLSVVSLLVAYHSIYDMLLFVIPSAYVLRYLHDGNVRTGPWLAKAATFNICLSTALLWYVLPFVDSFGVSSLGGHRFDGPHIISLWYVLMISVTALMAFLFVLVYNDKGHGQQI